MKILWIYLLVINVVTLILMGADKKKAIEHRWRIPERTLMGAALIGGSIGGLLGMFLFRHKTRHAKFVVGFPLFLILHIVLIVWFVW